MRTDEHRTFSARTDKHGKGYNAYLKWYFVLTVSLILSVLAKRQNTDSRKIYHKVW